jgi:hypothetical protein
MPCSSQAAKLFVGPISKTEIVGPIVIIIDALDESGNDKPVHGWYKSAGSGPHYRQGVYPSASLSEAIGYQSGGRLHSRPHVQYRALCKRLLITETSDVEADIERSLRTK